MQVGGLAGVRLIAAEILFPFLDRFDFVCLFVCLFPPPIGWFQIILIAVVFTFQMKIPNKNRKRNEIYQVDQ